MSDLARLYVKKKIIEDKLRIYQRVGVYDHNRQILIDGLEAINYQIIDAKRKEETGGGRK